MGFMKYSQLIFRTTFISIALGLSALQCIGQINTISPYSRFGIGELETQNSIFGYGVSGATVALSPYYSVNHTNPASYSSLIHPVFQTGITTKNFQLDDGNTKERNYLSKLNEISIGLPLNKGFGVAFGLMPYSSVGYELKDRSDTLVDNTAASFLYSGEGGFTKGFLGLSYRKKFIKDAVVFNAKGIATDTLNYLDSYLSLGVNGNLIFGESNYNRDVSFDDLLGSYHRLESNSMTIGDVNTTFGLLYKKNIKIKHESYKGESNKVSDWNVLFGASYTPESTLSITSTRLIQNATYRSSLDEIIALDTVFYSGNTKGKIVLPAELALGATLSIINKKQREFEFSLQWKNRNWENYSNSIDDNDTSEANFGNASTFSFGFQYTPQPLLFRDIPWYKTTLFQLGFKMGDGYLSFNDETLTEKRVSLGVSIPILGSRTLSRINLGMDFGTTGSTDNGLIKETSLNSYIGISLMPDMKRNGWFKQSKYR